MLDLILSALEPGDEVILHTVDDTGGDHEEVATVWKVKSDFVITSNGSVLTGDSTTKVTPTGINHGLFSFTADALKKYQQLISTSQLQVFEFESNVE